MSPAVRPRPLSHLVASILAVLGIALAITPAYADQEAETDAAIAAFQAGERVYVAASATATVDAAAVTELIGEPPVYIAVLEPNLTPQDVLFAVPNVLSGSYTVVIVSGTQYAVTSTAYCADQASSRLDETAGAHESERAGGDLTGWLSDYVDGIDDLDDAGSAACEGGEASGGGSMLWWVLGVLVLAAGLGYPWLRSRQRSHAQLIAGQRDEVAGLLERLGGEIDQAQPGGDPVTLRALNDAAARHDSAVDQLDAAETEDDISAARQAILEGLTASQVARERSGQPTTDVPALPSAYGERLEGAQQVESAGEVVFGYPSYTPGAPYFHRGGSGMSAGWYTSPVWEDAIIGSVLGPHSEEIATPRPDGRTSDR